jgi:hypothetical protein
MLEQEEKEIDGRRYIYQPLMLKPARSLFDKLVQKFGPALADGVAGLEAANLSEEQEFVESLGSIAGSAAGLLRGAVEGLDAKTHEYVADVIAAQMKVELTNDDGDTQVMELKKVRDLIFGKNLLTEFYVIAFALEVQYSDFLEPMQRAATMAIALRAKGAESRSTYPKGSSGRSTESPQASASATA